jgi:hypothetical protein
MQLITSNGLPVRIKGERFDEKNNRRVMSIAHPGALHSSSLFKKYGTFNCKYASAADYDFLLRCGTGIESIYLKFISVDMLTGGVSDGFQGLIETYRIQKKHGVDNYVATTRLVIALLKRLLRPIIRGY